jgi:hypothetical protein
MKFKKPRDPNTDPRIFKIRDVLPCENIRCQVGRGECMEFAIESQDDGEGGEFFLCPQHAKEFRELSVLIAEMTPNQIAQFDAAIHKAEANQLPT